MIHSPTRTSNAVVVGALVAIAALVTAAVMFTSGDQALERLAVLVAVIGSIVPGLLAALRADHAATQTNGGLDAKIQSAVQAALQVQRSTDVVTVSRADPPPDPIEPG